MKEVLSVWVPFLPPSSNKIYEPVWVKGKPMGKRLATSGRRFKVRAIKTIQEGGRAALMNLKEHIPYELTLAVFLEAIVNKGWVDKKADNKYKKIDVTNRIKLIEDAVADAVGVDDRHNFRLIVEKHCDPDNTGIYVVLNEVPEEEVGLTKEQYELRRHKHDRAGSSSTERWFLKSPSRAGARAADRSDRRSGRRRRRTEGPSR